MVRKAGWVNMMALIKRYYFKKSGGNSATPVHWSNLNKSVNFQMIITAGPAPIKYKRCEYLDGRKRASLQKLFSFPISETINERFETIKGVLTL